MLIGTMNHPAKDVIKEIEWIAGMGLEFVDLTLEPPAAALWNVDVEETRAVLKAHALPVVGHTAYYLPIASPFESVRRAAVEELKHCAEAFAKIGASWMNIHPDRNAPMHEKGFIIERNLQSLREINQTAQDVGVGLMIENLPGYYNTVQQLAPMLDAMPDLGFHLDLGHANLQVQHNSADELIATYGSRLRHVHFHDNKGDEKDLHLPLGTGNIDFRRYVRMLQKHGYDGTITLEVFTPDKHYLSYSRDVLRRLWNETSVGKVSAAAIATT
ncbi:sugar phosphate isomerase/epimerase family protein [Pedosphaera parvula]|uniref:Xylose isomerase domain protein TIM barrel n=1 Tax=Pedosphaera parvula (strain Ellin514) TaxID=320771 RepID=B9XN37_PEDPL|nr:sugar phosphate isomerase/epimerase family protein [Pedosphaera parvula]EEF58699.1 Xylose isomerase domain protein TIM barrel [Pedosphaera parvula Ellin514]